MTDVILGEVTFYNLKVTLERINAFLGRAQATMVSSVMNCMSYAAAILAAVLRKKRSHRVVTILGKHSLNSLKAMKRICSFG